MNNSPNNNPLQIPSNNPTDPWNDTIAATLYAFVSGQPVNEEQLRNTIRAMLERQQKADEEIFALGEQLDHAVSRLNALEARSIKQDWKIVSLRTWVRNLALMAGFPQVSNTIGQEMHNEALADAYDGAANNRNKKVVPITTGKQRRGQGL